MHRWNWSW